MGYYVNKIGELSLPAKGKAAVLLENGAQSANGTEFVPNLICVVDNGFFEAAAYCYSEEEFKEFSRNDGRQKIWLTHPNAKELAGY